MDRHQPTRLNGMQQYMLHLFDRDLTPQQETDIRQLLSNYFAKLVEDELAILVSEKEITAELLEKEVTVHRRTPYRPER